MHTTHYVGGF